MRISAALCLGLCLLAVACRSAAPVPPPPLGPAARPNLLRNADFLVDTRGWQVVPDPLPPSLTLARDQAGFLSLSLGETSQPLSAGWAQSLDVRAGACYYASCRVRTDKLAGRADLRLSFYDADGRLLGERGLVPVSGDTHWAMLAGRCCAPPGATQVTLTLGVTQATSGQAAFAEPQWIPDDAPMTRALIVDYAQETGTLRDLSPATRLAYGPLDLRTVFPNPQANPGDPASYDFRASDAALAAVVEGGAELFFRLGAGGGLEPGLWAEVVRHVAMHYNDGWAQGRRYGIRYWEVAGGGGRPEQDYQLLATTIAALKGYDPELKVGGPALATPAQMPYLEGLLRDLAERGLRPDFLSWQVDDDSSPRASALAEVQVERLLDRYGFSDAEVIAGGWGLPGADSAAGLAACWAYWQDTRLAQVCRGEAKPQAAGSGQARRWLAQFPATPRRLLAQGGDELGFSLLAGKSADGRRVSILVADTGSRSEGYRLALAGFPLGLCYTVSEIAEGRAGAVVAQGDLDWLPDRVLALPWHPPAVHLIEVGPAG